MPPPLIVDLSNVERNRVLMNQEQIYTLLPHRHEFMVLDGICHLDAEKLQVVGFCDVKEGDWWCRGHVPGRPLLPGVLMLEMAAQLCAVLAKSTYAYTGFIGYGGVEQCKFREAVVPPTRLWLLGAGIEHRPRRIVSAAQGLVDDRLVFETRVIGVPMR